MFKLLAITISLLTCEPGEALYERYGHTAIRIVDTEQQMDACFNYGLFDFNTDLFYLKFMRGETYYFLGAENTASFLSQYAVEGRRVYEQVFDFTDEEAARVEQALLTNYQPENRQYLYNFIYDNCATRPYHILSNALSEPIRSLYAGWDGFTYRDILSHYTGHGSWADFGINLLFGSKADQRVHDTERLFLPEQVMDYFAGARRQNGQLLVRGDVDTFPIPRVKWYQTWYAGMSILLVMLLILSIYDRIREKRTRWVDNVLYTFYIVLILLVAFLTFFSLHPLVGFGWRMLIIPAIHLLGRAPYYIRLHR